MARKTHRPEIAQMAIEEQKWHADCWHGWKNSDAGKGRRGNE